MGDSLYRKVFKTPAETLRGLLAEYIYRYESTSEKPEEFLDDVREREGLSEEEVDRLRKLIGYYLENEDTIYDHLSNTLVGWRPERLLALDRAAILAGITEMLAGDGDPERIIYDYGTFAKRFSADKSPSFVMGVLKSFRKRLNGGTE